MIKSPNINSENSGFTVATIGTNEYLAKIRAEYSFPNYLTSEYYNYVSRYAKIRRIQDNNEIFHETYNNYKIPESSSDKYVTVNNATENRLDIISVRYYRSPIMWWVIALANNIIDPFTEIPAGTVLRIPAMTSIYESGIV